MRPSGTADYLRSQLGKPRAIWLACLGWEYARPQGNTEGSGRVANASAEIAQGRLQRLYALLRT